MSSSSGYRGKFTEVKTAKRRKTSSTRWLKRQLNDPFVAKSKLDGYRSRAAYKLIEINDKFQICFEIFDSCVTLSEPAVIHVKEFSNLN